MMLYPSLCSSTLALFALPALARLTADKTCTPLANGFAAIDDSPAINAALGECGAGGTIVLPADQAYSLFTPLDFSACRNCDVQIEGTLILAAEQLPYYGTLPYNANGSTRSVFTIANATGVRIRSVTGSGTVDGNAVSWYQRSNWSPKNGGYPFVHVNGSSDISISNLRFKNIQDRVFRLEGHSTNLQFEDLKITAEGINPIYASFDNFAFEMGRVENVSISNVDIDFRAQAGSDSPVGTCISFDHGTDGVVVTDVTCRRAFMGAAIQFDTIGGGFAPTAANATATVSNVVVSNFTFAGMHATGVESWFNLSKKVIRNVVWEWVTVEEGTPAEFDPCYATERDTQYYPQCLKYATYDAEVVFRHYRGKVGSPPTDPNWGEVNALMDVKPVFEDWVADA